MNSYCLTCKRDTENITKRVSNTSNGKAMLLSECAKCASKKSRSIKNHEAKYGEVKYGYWVILCFKCIK